MGDSATAKMFWGFPVSQDDEEVTAKLEDWEDRYCAAKGAPPPTGDYASDKYREYLDKKKPLIDAAGCEVGHHGYEYDSDFVCVSESEISVEWGEARKLDSLYVVGLDWEAKLKDFCEALGIPYQEPGWYLVAHYG